MLRRKGVVDPVKGVLAVGLFYFIHAFSRQSSRWIYPFLNSKFAQPVTLTLYFYLYLYSSCYNRKGWVQTVKIKKNTRWNRHFWVKLGSDVYIHIWNLNPSWHPNPTKFNPAVQVTLIVTSQEQVVSALTAIKCSPLLIYF